MRAKLLLLFLLCCFARLACGQDTALKSIRIDTAFTRKTVDGDRLDSFYSGLRSVQSSPYQAHIRISITGMAIDFFSADGIYYQGTVTNFATEYRRKKQKADDYERQEEYQVWFAQTRLPSAAVNKVVTALLQSGQPDIPTDTLIPGWSQMVLHGHSLRFHFRIGGLFKAQNFLAPKSQPDSIRYAKTVVQNYELIWTELPLDTLRDQFRQRLPQGRTYSDDGYRFAYRLTDQQIEWRNKDQPRRDFLKSVKDTVDAYILAELAKQNIDRGGDYCFKDFYLTFGTNGQLKQVHVPRDDWPKRRDADSHSEFRAKKRELQRCLALVRRMFNKIDLRFAKLQYELYRVFSFGIYGDVVLRDNTIY